MSSHFLAARSSQLAAGFTLIETLAAISLLMVAIVAPMSLVVQSLSAAVYARDQITAYYLAQEGLEAVHAIQDGNILQIAQNPNSTVDLFSGIDQFAGGDAFTIDATNNNAAADCKTTQPSGCPPIETNGTLYGYQGWTPTNFIRALQVCYVQAVSSPNPCDSNPTDEARITVTVFWQTESYQQRSFTISEDIYRWVQPGSAS